MNVALIIGSVREGRMASRATSFMVDAAKSREYQLDVVDPRTENLPLLEKRYMDYEPGKAPQTLERLHGLFQDADGFIFVSAEYNASIPPGLSNTVDHFKPEFSRKPVALVTYSMGPFGGARVEAQLRSLVAGVGTICTPTVLPIPSIMNQIDENGGMINKDMEGYVNGFLDEFDWYLKALAVAR